MVQCQLVPLLLVPNLSTNLTYNATLLTLSTTLHDNLHHVNLGELAVSLMLLGTLLVFVTTIVQPGSVALHTSHLVEIIAWKVVCP